MKKLDALIQEEDKLRRMKAEKTARTELPRTTEPTQPNPTKLDSTPTGCI